MTHDYQFHINGLKGIKPYLQSLMLYANCDGMGETDAKEIGETIDAAIEALEKQIPKKPLNASNKAGICPTCGNYVCFAWHESACGDCGQALDWSDAE